MHIYHDRKLRKLLDYELNRLNSTMSMNDNMSISLMVSVRDALRHNHESYEDSNNEDLAIMNRKAPE